MTGLITDKSFVIVVETKWDFFFAPSHFNLVFVIAKLWQDVFADLYRYGYKRKVKLIYHTALYLMRLGIFQLRNLFLNLRPN